DGPKFSAERAWDLVEAEKVNSMTIVGDAMARPLADVFAEHPGRWDTSSLLGIGSGGAPLSPAVKQQFAELLPNVMVLDSFGSSETGYQGRATEGRRFAVDETNAVFDDNFERVEPGSGEVGRLAKTGRIPIGYYNDPEKTAHTFVEVEDKRWSFPGDLATVEEDGTINLLGRGSASINSGGEKIYPEEVEDALKSHADVFDVLVVGVPDGQWGGRGGRPPQVLPSTWVDTRYGNDQATTGCTAQRQEGTEGGEEQEEHRPHAQEDAHGARQAGRGRGQAQAHGRHAPQNQIRADEDRSEARPRRPL